MFADCTSEEREICWWYEYAREGCRGAPVQLPLFPDLGEDWWRALYPEWPGKAYLTIPAPQREKRLNESQGGAPDKLRSLNLMPCFSPPLSPAVAKDYLDGFRVFELSEDGKTLQLKHTWPIHEISDAGWEVIFRIDWERSNSELSADFTAWLKEHRPKTFPSQAGSETGAGSLSRRLQAELKALGAWRLLDFYKCWQNIPAEAAIYESEAGWLTAHQKAENRLKFFRLPEPNG